MSILDKFGYKFLDDTKNGYSDYIVIESSRIEEYIDYINKNDIRSIYFCDSYYDFNDIEILKRCPNIENVNIYSSGINDYSGLHNLNGLKTLFCNDVRDFIDLTEFNSIEDLAIELNKKVTGISSCSSLQRLLIWKYNPKSKDLTELSKLHLLKELIITQSTITSLKGCADLQKLNKLELNYLRKLEFIDELELNANTLKHLRFDSCKNIKNHKYVTCLKELELLAFDECGEIPTINFIRDFPKLKSFIFVNTNVVDGDLSPCEGLEYVGFLNKKHYSHKFEDFKRK